MGRVSSTVAREKARTCLPGLFPLRTPLPEKKELHMEQNTPYQDLSLRNFLSGVLDLRFRSYLSMQLLPLFYVLLLLGAGCTLALLTGLAFWVHPWAGLTMLVLAPLAFLVAAAVIRAALEFLVMAYRIMQTVHDMQQIPTQVDNLNTKVDRISAGFDSIPERIGDLQQTVGLLQPILRLLHLPFGGRRRDKPF